MAAAISGALSIYHISKGEEGEFVDVIIILAVVLINAVLGVLQEQDIEQIAAYKDQCNIEIYELNSRCSFDLKLTGKRGDDVATVRIKENHTNVVAVTRNDVSLLGRYCETHDENVTAESAKELRENLLNLRCVGFLDGTDPGADLLLERK